MLISAIVVGVDLNEIVTTLKSFSSAEDYVSEIVVIDSSEVASVSNYHYIREILKIPVKIFFASRDGICAAFNRGIEFASGDYIMFVNSGDSLLLDGLKSACLRLNPSVSIVASPVEIYSSEGQFIRIWTGLDKRNHIVQIHQQGCIYKKSLHVTFGSFASLFSCAMDTSFFAPILKRPNEYMIVYNDKPVVRFFLGGVSSVQAIRTMLEYFVISSLSSRRPVFFFLTRLPFFLVRLLAKCLLVIAPIF